jgi:lipoprotein-anchoring transpeptidase ErfK/SrfK
MKKPVHHKFMMHRLFIGLAGWVWGLSILVPPVLAQEVGWGNYQYPVEESTPNPSVQVVIHRRSHTLQVLDAEGTLFRTYPIAIGKAAWPTPQGKFQVLKKIENPIFQSFRTGALTASGKANPLGQYYVQYHEGKVGEFGIHGTDEEDSIGKSVSHGCIRMHNKDIAELYQLVDMGTSVTID